MGTSEILVANNFKIFCRFSLYYQIIIASQKLCIVIPSQMTKQKKQFHSQRYVINLLIITVTIEQN